MKYRVAIAGVSLALSACGGGDGGGSTPPVSSPAPSPTPTPTPTYVKFADLAEDTVFDTSCRGFETLADGSNRIYDDPVFGEGLTISFDASSSSYTVEGEEFSYTFSPSSKQNSAGADIYRISNGSGVITDLVFYPLTAEYSRLVSLHRIGSGLPTALISCAVGIRTEAGDLPGSNASYDPLSVFGSAMLGGDQYNLDDTSGGIAFEAGTDSVTFALQLAGNLEGGGTITDTVYELGSLNSLAPVPAAGGTFAGATAKSDASSVSGDFGGAFFGPAGVEVGFVFNYSGTLDDGRAFSGVGTYLGRKKD
ncbi:hypothetical protein K3181_01920 [Qipengyuania sp. YG27]|uniref:Transferrin-binding protein B C-lobe/N-lobe beta barrel domain-containing protein n=1 Tax=Qipengyuania mesophila TaxID=2867246 RepID=A0ABS7JRE5_9SPHN|nr:hypothetical protein [Qipengyuania mesophila]MBX7500200.1 hypothetical protein [Qipengyuania mesophila]